MNIRMERHAVLGACLFASNDVAEIGIPLDYGLRIGYFAFHGGSNVFFEQPADMADLSTPQGWRLRGGHRLWLVPESEKTSYPDNAPVKWQAEDGRITVVQPEDPWLKVVKRMTVVFGEGAEAEIIHSVENVGSEALRCALWGVSSMAPGGTQRLRFEQRTGGYDPWHHVSMWDYTSLGDPRAAYNLHGSTLRHRPLEQRYKIGVGHPLSPVEYENGGVTFSLGWAVDPDAEYPDGGVSYETFMCRHMVELETLSPLVTLSPGERREHRETWTLRKKEVNDEGQYCSGGACASL